MSVFEETGSRSGTRFKRREINAGQRPRDNKPKPYSVISGKQDGYMTIVNSSGDIIRDGPYLKDFLNYCPFVDGYPSGSELARIQTRNKARQKLFDKLSQADSLYETWAEREKSLEAVMVMFKRAMTLIKILRNPITAVKQANAWRRKLKGRQFKSRKWREWQRRELQDQAGKVPSWWLEYNFGWKPLILGVDGALSAFRTSIPIGVYKGTSSHDDSVRGYVGEGEIGNTTFRYLYSVGCKVKPKYDAVTSSHIGLLTGFGLDKPLTNVFAVLPWGWVLDYFVNVSQFLSNLEPRFPHCIIYDTWETEFIKGTQDSIEDPQYWGNFKATISHRFDFATMSRNLNPRLDYELSINLNPLNARRVSYIASALVGTLSSRRK